MRELARQIELLAQSERAVALLVGEGGTGKGQLAEYIHARSAHSARPFLALDAAMLNRSDAGAELFGSGGPAGASGAIAAADGGTLFVEEASELSAELQNGLVALVEAAQNPLTSVSPAGVRIIAASSVDLVNAVNEGRFREDLYYRLGVMPVHLPPLRARAREDLVGLIAATFTSLSMKMSNAPRAIAEDVTDTLIAYSWPGNIRELRNALERAMLVARGEPELRRAHLAAELRDGDDDRDGGALHTPRTLMDIERAHIHRTLRAHKLNRTHAARELGISRATLIKKIKEYGLVYTAPGSQ